MKKLITLILIAAILMANIPVVWAEETDAEYIIDLDDIPYEEIIMPPWFTSGGLPYIIEPDMAVWLVFYNIFLWYRQIYGAEE